MKFAFAIALISTAASTFAVQLAYDDVYGNANGDLTTVACSTGSNGLITAGYTTFGSLPNFPNVGAAQAVTAFNSPNCGTCWNITYTNSSGASKSVAITAIDVAGSGFVVSQGVMDTLTDGNAVQFGVVDVASSQVDKSVCGFD